ncbi:MAG: HAD family hydrolase [Acidimicrobiia bacterium]
MSMDSASHSNSGEPVDLIIFDCDGVLVDSERLYVRYDTGVLNELGWTITEDEVIERFMGRTNAYMLSEIEGKLGRNIEEEWRGPIARGRQDLFRRELTPVPGIVEAMDQLDTPTCVASSSTHEMLDLVLGVTGLTDRFTGRVFSGVDVEHGKPAPDLFLLAAESMGVAPQRCLVVEDSRTGVEAARAAGMRCLGFHGGITPAAHLEGEGTVVFASMDDLPALVTSGGTPSAKSS